MNVVFHYYTVPEMGWQWLG